MSVLPAGVRSLANAGAGARAIGACVLLLCEIITLDAIYDVRRISADVTPLWLSVNAFIKHGLYAGLYALAALALLLWPQRTAIAARLRQAASAAGWPVALGANLLIFASVLSLMLAARAVDALTWITLPLLVCAGLAIVFSAALSAAPLRFWRGFARAYAVSLALAACAGAMIAGAALMAQNAWAPLSGATLQLSHGLLSLFETRVEMNAAERLLGVGDFRVIIDSYCSGYEGVGLVLSALGLYLFLFRAQLRFPDVLILLPLGAALVWLLNGVRIALLVSIGAHVSPDLALTGFHSQAGWIVFVGVSAALMASAQTFFQKSRSRIRSATKLAAALIAPFAALMAARILAGTFGGAPWTTVLAMLIPFAALLCFRRTLSVVLRGASWEGALVGLTVGALWIVTESPAPDAPLGAWLATQDQAMAALWLALRISGFALIVPIAEELAFRGYMHRALARRRFEEAQEGGFSWLAFILTSLAFGLLHERWIAGALAGVAFALVLYRTKSLAGPITAHIAANGLIAAYAVTTGAWALL